MKISPEQLIPTFNQGLHGAGFLFGAGASKEAGYPLMGDLTKKVVGSLEDTFATLDEIFDADGIEFNKESGEPNIEVIYDTVVEYQIQTKDPRYTALLNKIREKIVEVIVDIKDPDISHHVNFFNNLKHRAHGQAVTVWIFTTNYDLLFERAAAETGISINNGFDGSVYRYFNPDQFSLSRGVLTGQRFTQKKELVINLVKLHGSVSWTKQGDQVFESPTNINLSPDERFMVLPRRQKVLETLNRPFDSLFHYSSKIIGRECKYIVSCGFSFGDQHINQHLLLPPLRDGGLRLTSLCNEETIGTKELNKFPSFNLCTNNSCSFGGMTTNEGTDLWRFSKLVDLLA